MTEEHDGDQPRTEAPLPLPLRRAQETDAQPGITGGEAYNVVTDTVTGVNIRWRDNVIQAIAVGAGALIGAGVGMLFTPELRIIGAMLGAIAGLIAGVLLSGIGLMIYRGVRHLRGKHD